MSTTTYPTREEFNERVLENCLNVVTTNWSWGHFQDTYEGCPGLSKFLVKAVLKLYCRYPIKDPVGELAELKLLIEVYGTPLYKVMQEEEDV